MTTAIVSIILTFVMTGVIGNRLLQQWQHRNWISQQRFLGEEKQYLLMLSLWEELIQMSSKRLWRMRRVLAAISGDNSTIEERFKQYDEVMSEWNEKYHSMCVRLTLHLAHHLEQTMEQKLQPAFVVAGAQLERLVKLRLSTGAIDGALVRELRESFLQLSHEIFVFNRDVLNVVKEQKTRTYVGVELIPNRTNLEMFSTWELLKALFHPGMKPFRVIRTPSDL